MKAHPIKTSLKCQLFNFSDLNLDTMQKPDLDMQAHPIKTSLEFLPSDPAVQLRDNLQLL